MVYDYYLLEMGTLNIDKILNEVNELALCKELQEISEHCISERCERCWSELRSGRYSTSLVESQYLLDWTWEELNTGYWKDVNIAWRHLYTFASLVKCACLAKKSHFIEAIRAADMGLMMGAPLFDNVLAKMVQAINRHVMDNNCTSYNNKDVVEPSKKRGKQSESVPEINFEIKRIEPPSLVSFQTVYMHSERPVIIKNAALHWPAFSHRRWSIDYIKQVAGVRTVPVEIGDKYTSESWTQKLITVGDFIEKFIVNNDSSGYLAQHQLFEQIPELRDDICIPDYCWLSEVENNRVMTNAWFGPQGTISPLHHDPYNNLFVQVIGQKYVRLYDRKLLDHVYPHHGTLMDNTSRVDVENVDREKFPLFENAEYVECVLNEGEMLYIPPKWWHYVRSLDTSFSISFWWSN